MRKFFTLFILLTMLSGAAHAQQMSDKQVVEYLKRAQATGKSQSETAMELMRRGVTRQQVERIRNRYLQEQQVANLSQNAASDESQERLRYSDRKSVV